MSEGPRKPVVPRRGGHADGLTLPLHVGAGSCRSPLQQATRNNRRAPRRPTSHARKEPNHDKAVRLLFFRDAVPSPLANRVWRDIGETADDQTVERIIESPFVAVRAAHAHRTGACVLENLLPDAVAMPLPLPLSCVSIYLLRKVGLKWNFIGCSRPMDG